MEKTEHISLDHGEALEGYGLYESKVNIDASAPSRIRSLHPTLRRCKCGYTASSHMVTEHISSLRKQAEQFFQDFDPKHFWQFHGEIPLNQGDE